jgi:hypothetical protein
MSGVSTYLDREAKENPKGLCNYWNRFGDLYDSTISPNKEYRIEKLSDFLLSDSYSDSEADLTLSVEVISF